MEQNNKYLVTSADRALALLTLVSERGELGVHDGARALNVAASTAHRLLLTLAHRGYVMQGGDRRFRPGPALLQQRAEPRIPKLISAVRPALRDLHEATAETVHLMVLVGQDTRIIDGLESPKSLRVGLRVGSRVPAYATAGGKAMMAKLPRHELRSRCRDGLPPWPGAHANTLEELEHELKEVNRRKYGLNQDESELGVSALGAAFGGHDSEPLAAIAIAVPTARFAVLDKDSVSSALIHACERAQLELRQQIENTHW